MPGQPPPFKTDYTEDISETSAEASPKDAAFKLATEKLEFKTDYLTGSTQTPSIGKPYGTGKPQRVILRGKITRD